MVFGSARIGTHVRGSKVTIEPLYVRLTSMSRKLSKATETRGNRRDRVCETQHKRPKKTRHVLAGFSLRVTPQGLSPPLINAGVQFAFHVTLGHILKINHANLGGLAR